MRSDELAGCAVDPAVQLFASTYGQLFRLAAEVGALDLLVRSRGRDALWRNGRSHAITYGSVASLAASTALPASLKVRLATRYLPFLATNARHLDANDPAGTGGARFDDASVTEWGEAQLGREFVELLAYPLLGAYYGGPPERISVALYHALAKVATDVRVYGVAGGVGALAQAILTALRLRGVQWRGGESVRLVSSDDATPAGAASRIAGAADRGGEALERGAPRPREKTLIVYSATGEERYDGAVVAVPAPVVAGLVAAGTELEEWLAAVETTPAVTVALALDTPLDAGCFGLSFPRQTRPGRTIIAACFEHHKLPGLVPDGAGLIVAYAAPTIIPAMLADEPEAIVDQTLAALTDVFPRIADQVTRARVYRLREGYTLFYPGYLRHLARREERWLSPRIALAGDYLVAPTVEGAMISGRRAAKSLVRGFGR